MVAQYVAAAHNKVHKQAFRLEKLRGGGPAGGCLGSPTHQTRDLSTLQTAVAKADVIV